MSCTLPANNTAYVSTPNIRGTLDIITGSLSVIVLSTWSILHLNVPFASKPKNKRQWTSRWLTRAAVKCCWMLMAIAGPELLVGRALVQLVRANRSCREMQHFAKLDNVEWTKVHSFFADMKGFEVVFTRGETEPDQCLGSSREVDARKGRTQTHIALLGASLAKLTLTLHPRSASDARPHRHFQPGDRMKPLPQISILACRGGSQDLHHFEGWNDDDPDSGDFGRYGHIDPRMAQSEYQRRSGFDLKYAASDASQHTQSWYDILTYHGMTTMSKAVILLQQQARYLGTFTWAPDPTNFETAMKAEQIFPYHEVRSQGKQASGWDLYAFMGSSWRVNATQLTQLRAWGIIESLPDISQDDLEGRGSADAFLKAITLFQIIWQLVDVIVRSSENLPIAPLEVLALALSACAVLTYTCLWRKPQGVLTSVRIQATRYATPQEMIELTVNGDARDEGPLKLGAFGVDSTETNMNPDKQDRGYFLFGILTGSAIFGSLHFLSWNHVFPSAIERDLWHAAALTSLIGPWIAAGVYEIAFTNILPWFQRRPRRSFLRFCLICISSWMAMLTQFLYISVRLFVFIECFRSVFHLQPKAFQSTWTVDIPHFR